MKTEAGMIIPFAILAAMFVLPFHIADGKYPTPGGGLPASQMYTPRTETPR